VIIIILNLYNNLANPTNNNNTLLFLNNRYRNTKISENIQFKSALKDNEIHDDKDGTNFLVEPFSEKLFFIFFFFHQ